MRRSSRRLYAPTPLGTFRELTTLNKNPSTPHAQVPTAKFLELTISQNDQTMKKLVHPLFLRERDTNPLLSQQPTGTSEATRAELSFPCAELSLRRAFLAQSFPCAELYLCKTRVASVLWTPSSEPSLFAPCAELYQ